MSTFRLCLLTILIVVPAVMRLSDLGWNFVPIGAVALFAGATFRNRTLAFAVPMGAMILSDLALGWRRHDFMFYTFHATLPFVYGCYALSVCLGFGVRRRWAKLEASAAESAPVEPEPTTDRDGLLTRRMLPVAGGTLAGALLFFLITNFGDWLVFWDNKSWSSLLECYAVAIPFFRNTLAADAIGAVILFGGYEIVCRRAAVADPSGLLHAR